MHQPYSQRLIGALGPAQARLLGGLALASLVVALGTYSKLFDKAMSNVVEVQARGAHVLALTTDNLGILWVSVEGATLATVLLVSLYRTPEAVEAAWKYFILCGVGLAQALFGTILVYFAAQLALTARKACWTSARC